MSSILSNYFKSSNTLQLRLRNSGWDVQPLHQLSWEGLAPDYQQSRNVLNIQIFQFQYAETVGGRRRKCLENIWKLFWWHVVYEINWCCQPCETCACSAILCADMTTQSFHWPTKQQHVGLSHPPGMPQSIFCRHRVSKVISLTSHLVEYLPLPPHQTTAVTRASKTGTWSVSVIRPYKGCWWRSVVDSPTGSNYNDDSSLENIF